MSPAPPASSPSERLYRQIIDGLKEVVFQTDPQGRWTFLNPAWTELTGFALEEALGHDALEFVQPEDRPRTQELLQSVIGSSAVSLGVLLATFMGGMALGSVAAPFLIRSNVHPLRAVGYLELGIGAIGLLVLLLMPSVARAYASWGGYGPTGILLRGVVAGVCLLPPTMAMGATLPVLARWIGTTPAGRLR